MAELNQSTIEKLEYYVYLLVDPTNNEIFYVGKGKGNRINAHSLDALIHDKKVSDKLERIRSISRNQSDLKLYVLRHGLSEHEAFEVESAVIDLLHLIPGHTLTNIVSGHDSDERGLMSLLDLELKYQAEPAKFEHPALLITVNRLYRPNMSAEELYDITRSAWKLSKDKAEQMQLACAVYRGIVREVYVPEKWQYHPEHTDRVLFHGKVAHEELRSKYRFKSVKHLTKQGASNPIRYVGVS